MNQNPIGVFDSGLGGLTVVKELRRLLPGEDILYFGDTGRVPYGSKSADTVLRFGRQDIALLQRGNVKMIVAACNTVASTFEKASCDHFDFPYMGVVRPAAKAAALATRTGRIGVIGTAATIKNGVYPRLIRQCLPSAQVTEKSCPLFVPLVENGYFTKDNPVARLVAEEYLAPLKAAEIDTLILGCTHYPFLADIIGDIMGKDVILIDSGRETAKEVRGLLLEKGLLSGRTEGGKCRFLVSDGVDSFRQYASLFLGEALKEQDSYALADASELE